MSASEVEVSVVLPTLDEAGNVGPLLEELAEVLGDRTFEAVVVDGGSTDATVAEARAVDGPVRVIEPEGDLGLGPSVVEGLEAARGRYAVVIDADGQHPATVVPRLVATAERQGVDLVAGTRFREGGQDRGLGPGREVVSWVARGLAWLALPTVRRLGISDPTSGLFLVDLEVLDVEDIDARGYKIMLDVLVQGDIETVAETGYVFQERETGSSNLGAGTVATYLVHLTELSIAERWNRRLLLFGLVGLLGVLVNLGILYALTEVAGLHYLMSAAVAVEASIVHNWAWNDTVTFRGRRGLTWYQRLFRFNLVSLGSMVVNLVVLFALVEAGGLHYLVAATIAIAVAFAANLGFNLTWVYPRPHKEGA